MKNKKKTEVSIVRSSAAEYLTFIASTGDNEQSVEMRYQDENIWLTQGKFPPRLRSYTQKPSLRSTGLCKTGCSRVILIGLLIS
jgi:hypothetical protein